MTQIQNLSAFISEPRNIQVTADHLNAKDNFKRNYPEVIINVILTTKE